MLAVGDRVELAETINEGNNLTLTMATVLTVGRQGTVVKITKNHLYVVNFDVPEQIPVGFSASDFKRWFLPDKSLKRVGARTYSSMITAKRDELTNRYTNSLYYEELGIGLKELIDRLIEAEYKLERINTISKKAK
ncbi:Hypothetical Protein OBI_RACECAR_221 [Arthrobacter phage Racecar]|nr:hypothetical protein PBI_RACECAR_13 [Arthrobacter phage Racecar]QFG12698.1 hypothetical protein PBI_MIMI_13 [Arthrobacter phage Mimi]